MIGWNLRNSKLINAIVDFPEWLFYVFNIYQFRKKLKTNKFPSKNEMFSSLGYFIVAKKINDI